MKFITICKSVCYFLLTSAIQILAEVRKNFLAPIILEGKMTISGITDPFVRGAASAAGAMAAQKGVEIVKKVDRYNVENNPPPRDRDGKILTDGEGRQQIPFSAVEQALIYGGIAAAATGTAPIGGPVVGAVGVALFASRVAQSNLE